MIDDLISCTFKNLLYCFIALTMLIIPFSLANSAVYDAKVQFANRVTLSVPVSGVIKSVNAVVGQRTQTGKILVELDQIPFAGAVVQANADVTINASKKTEAIRDHEQAQELYDRTVLSNVELENARLKADRAVAAYNTAKAKLTLADFNLKHSKIIAPFNGLVLKVLAKENENVNNALASQPLLVLAAEGQYTVKMLAPLSELASFSKGQEVKVTVGNKQFSGMLMSIALEPADAVLLASFEKQGVYYEVDVKINTGNYVLRAGQAAQMEMP